MNKTQKLSSLAVGFAAVISIGLQNAALAIRAMPQDNQKDIPTQRDLPRAEPRELPREQPQDLPREAQRELPPAAPAQPKTPEPTPAPRNHEKPWIDARPDLPL